ncbi:NAD(P)-binding protein [Macrolepiota fuliginosa MF-IS2]|uniref:NAD(P)-binding protein n=1 Tax=Macrolepiota fuliginosa MF-IS2 TaxID=1400762 RepID=A0A9P5XGQ2_9AGAR|nr:NAD(P)-binding protein [Macrolepiota fuliginosa MF-IS2]
MSESLPQITREYHLSEIGTYKNLVVEEKAVKPPKPHEVLVKVHAVSLQYRDLVVAGGFYTGNARVPEKLVPCSDMAGEIIALGDGVADWKIGDRVCANLVLDHVHGDTNFAIQQTSMGGQAHGCLTQYRTFPAHSLVRFPDFWSYEEASTLPCAALTAYNALNGPRRIKAGDYVLMLGTGGVAIFGLQFALAAGAIIIITSSSDDKLQIASKLGAQHVINYNKFPDWDDEVLKITNGVGVDHVLEVGGEGTLPRSINAVRMAGYVHIIGFVSKEVNNINIVGRTIRKGILLRGIQIGSVEQFKEMVKLIIANPEKTRPVIDRVFPFGEAMGAFAYLEKQQHVGKVVIKVT